MKKIIIAIAVLVLSGMIFITVLNITKKDKKQENDQPLGIHESEYMTFELLINKYVNGCFYNIYEEDFNNLSHDYLINMVYENTPNQIDVNISNIARGTSVDLIQGKSVNDMENTLNSLFYKKDLKLDKKDSNNKKYVSDSDAFVSKMDLGELISCEKTVYQTITDAKKTENTLTLEVIESLGDLKSIKDKDGKDIETYADETSIQLIDGLSALEYMKKYPDKFTKYKYTFVLEYQEYKLDKLEKIN